MDGDLQLVEMELREIQMKDDTLTYQIIVLGEKDGSREFPILIGYAEAIALDLTLHGKEAPRPMTHDLVLNVIKGLGGELRRVVVDNLKDNIFFGKLVVRTAQGGETWIDTRPSDAIVIATKRRVPIFVAEQVLQDVLSESEGGEEGEGGEGGEESEGGETGE
ncbi:MAG: bifunctional nuclease family protein [bacterium]|nr:bifunctional nuclease family protein [bacterium]